MHFARSLVALILAVAVLATPVRRDAAKVESDIKDVTTSTKSLDNSVIAFPDNDGTFDQAWDIHEDALALVNLAQTATEDAKAAGPMSSAESSVILGLVKAYVPVAQQTSSDLVAKKAALGQVPGALTLAGKDLGTLQTSAQGLEAAVKANAPADSAAEYQGPFDQINKALADAVNAYT